MLSRSVGHLPLRPYLFGRPLFAVTDHRYWSRLFAVKNSSSSLPCGSLKHQQYGMTNLYRWRNTHRLILPVSRPRCEISEVRTRHNHYLRGGPISPTSRYVIFLYFQGGSIDGATRLSSSPSYRRSFWRYRGPSENLELQIIGVCYCICS